MSGDSNCVIIIGILEGRHFPRLRPDDELFVEAKFGNKLLSTDRVPAKEKPGFNCELGFDLLRKELQLHRLNRTPVKLQVFTHSSTSLGFSSPLGQIVLDLKQAKDSPNELIWFPVLHCKHRGTRPDILLSFYIETAKSQVLQVVSSQKEPSSTRETKPKAPISISSSRAASPDFPTRPEPEPDPAPEEEEEAQPDVPMDQGLLLSEDGGYYLFSREGDRGRIFRLTVTVVFAERLELLKPSVSSGPYCFCYDLLGNQVYSEPFPRLEEADFPAERATVRIKAPRVTMYNFISDLNHLNVFLVSQYQAGKTVIGQAKVPLLSLLANGVAEGIYPIGDEFQNVQLENAPCVGLSVAMFLEENQSNNTSSSSTAQDTPVPGKAEPNSNSGSVADSSKSNIGITERNSNAGSDKAGTAPKVESLGENTDKDASNVASEGSLKSSVTEKSETASRNSKRGNEEVQNRDTSNHKSKTGSGNSKSKVSHKRHSKTGGTENNVSTSMKALKGSTERNESEAVGQDLNQADGSPASDGTMGTQLKDVPQPNPRDETNASTLADVLTHFCLNIDLRSIRFINRPPAPACFVQYSYPFVGATKHIQTSSFHTDLRKKVISDGQHTFCFVTSFARLREAFQRLPLTLELVASHNNNNIGLAHVYLEPLLNAPTAFFSHSEQVKSHRSTFSCEVAFMNRESPAVAEMAVFTSLDRLHGKADTNCVMQMQPKQPSFYEIDSDVHMQASKHVRQPTETELRVALELEIWREQQEEMFRANLKKKEETHLAALAQEWKERDAEREMLLKTRISECLRLEEKLRKALCDVDNRELKLHRKEESLRRQESDLRQKAEESEKRMKQLEAEKRSKLEYHSDETERLLRARILSLENELKDTKGSLDKALSSKTKYKRMWASTFKDLLATRNLVSAPVSIPQAPLLSMGSPRAHTEPKSLITEQRTLLEKEKSELKNIQQEVQRLKDLSQLNLDSSSSFETTGDLGNTSRVDSVYLQGLIDERNMLLRTGSYSPKHRVIQQLDTHIQIARNSL